MSVVVDMGDGMLFTDFSVVALVLGKVLAIGVVLIVVVVGRGVVIDGLTVVLVWLVLKLSTCGGGIVIRKVGTHFKVLSKTKPNLHFSRLLFTSAALVIL